MRITRREGLLSAASLVVGACARTASTPLGAGHKPIVVIGAGLAGLAAAIELVDSGRDVVLLEAQLRPGGRILTLRAPLSDSLFVEAGATHIVGDPDLLALIARAGASVYQPKPTPGLATVEYFDGMRTRYEAGKEPPERRTFSSDEERLGFMGRLEKYFGFVKGADPTIPWPPPPLAHYDTLTGAEFLQGAGASPGYIEDFAKAFVGERITDVSGAFVLREMADFFKDFETDFERPSGGRLVGGSDRLPVGLARLLGTRVVYGAEVKRIEQLDEGARVGFVREGELHQVDAERVICAIPYSVLREIQVEPAFSETKQRVIRELPMVSVARVFAQFDQRLWLTRGEAGDARTDLPMGAVRDETKFEQGPAGILGVYASADRARTIAKMAEPERLRAFVEGVENVHPGVKAHFVVGATKCWDEDPFARGAYAYFKPGQMTSFGTAISSAEGRIHFAGDHTSYRPGFMHGAIASAKRAVGEVLSSRG